MRVNYRYLFIDPDEKSLLFVVPNSTGVRPIARHARRQQQRGHGLVEQEVILCGTKGGMGKTRIPEILNLQA